MQTNDIVLIALQPKIKEVEEIKNWNGSKQPVNPVEPGILISQKSDTRDLDVSQDSDMTNITESSFGIRLQEVKAKQKVIFDLKLIFLMLHLVMEIMYFCYYDFRQNLLN